MYIYIHIYIRIMLHIDIQHTWNIHGNSSGAIDNTADGLIYRVILAGLLGTITTYCRNVYPRYPKTKVFSHGLFDLI
jgi:hypothetical protein